MNPVRNRHALIGASALVLAILAVNAPARALARHNAAGPPCKPAYFGDEDALRAIEGGPGIDIPANGELCERLESEGLALDFLSGGGVMHGRIVAWVSVGLVTADGLYTSRERHSTTIVTDDDAAGNSQRALLDALQRSISEIARAPDSYIRSIPPRPRLEDDRRMRR